ncbi:MAG: response regulator, partial [Magnetococcales bacterium]|nr:response regulator [Magnetococcales bacterium]
QGLRVLLAEDNEINQQVARELLEEEGIVVQIAANGEEAVAAVKADSFDLVLMDIQMPVMDGYAATQAIRADAKFGAVPIIAMTANAMSGDREKCMDAGMNDHISKPIHPSTMFATMAKYVQCRELVKPMNAKTSVPPFVVEEKIVLPNALEGIDMAAGLRNMNGNKKLYLKVLGDVYTRNHDIIAKIEAELAQGAQDVAVRLAHTFKGVSGTIGAGELHRLAALLEAALIKQDAPQVETVLKQLTPEVALVMEVLAPLVVQSPSLSVNESAPSTLDKNRLQELFAKLVILIDEGDSDAQDVVVSAVEMMGNTEHSKDMRLLTGQIEDYDFDMARETLQRVATALGLKV